MSSEMIRRVANAILDSGEGCLSGLAYVDPTKAARAAIEAMRDSTDKMFDAGCKACDDNCAFGCGANYVFEAMLSAALSSPAEDMSE